MRMVPQELKNKLLQQYAGTALDAMPKLKITAKQAGVNTLISEIIHDDISENFGDVAIRQLANESEPSLVYAICIDDGIGKIRSRRMPAFSYSKWEYVFDIGDVKDVAIEFNGTWNINSEKRYYELFTETTPYIFYVDNSDALYVQKWNDANTITLLAENVSQISVCRGWQSTLDTGVDQGLIIGYIKAGKVYYRSYCQQNDGGYIWETENEITELGSNNTSLCVFRTNDFRVGFITESNGEINYVLSKRTYAGQAMPSEHAVAWNDNVSFWMEDLVFHYPVLNESTLVNMESSYVACYDKDTPPLEVIESIRNGVRELALTFNRDVDRVPGTFENDFIAIPNKAIFTCVWQNNNQLKITFNEDLARSVPYQMTVSNCRQSWQYIGSQKMPIEDMVIVVPGAEMQVNHNETADVSMVNISVSIAEKTVSDYAMQESAEATIADVTLTLTPVDVIPI